MILGFLFDFLGGPSDDFWDLSEFFGDFFGIPVLILGTFWVFCVLFGDFLGFPC